MRWQELFYLLTCVFAPETFQVVPWTSRAFSQQQQLPYLNSLVLADNPKVVSGHLISLRSVLFGGRLKFVVA
jgi:hypothetical protein